MIGRSSCRLDPCRRRGPTRPTHFSKDEPHHSSGKGKGKGVVSHHDGFRHADAHFSACIRRPKTDSSNGREASPKGQSHPLLEPPCTTTLGTALSTIPTPAGRRPAHRDWDTDEVSRYSSSPMLVLPFLSRAIWLSTRKNTNSAAG
jgi:hypothetical protein